jgi:hypothetical protein
MLTALIVALIFMVIAFFRALYVIKGYQDDIKVLSEALTLQTNLYASLKTKMANYYNHGDVYDG